MPTYSAYLLRLPTAPTYCVYLLRLPTAPTLLTPLSCSPTPPTLPTAPTLLTPVSCSPARPTPPTPPHSTHSVHQAHAAMERVRSTLPYWNASKGLPGSDHIFLFSHDEGGCFAPQPVADAAIILSHWGRLDPEPHASSRYQACLCASCVCSHAHMDLLIFVCTRCTCTHTHAPYTCARAFTPGRQLGVRLALGRACTQRRAVALPWWVACHDRQARVPRPTQGAQVN